MKRFIILLDSRLRGNDGSSGFPLSRLRGHRFRGNDVLKIDIYLPISNLKSITFIRPGTQKRDEPFLFSMSINQTLGSFLYFLDSAAAEKAHRFAPLVLCLAQAQNRLQDWISRGWPWPRCLFLIFVL